MFIDEIKIIAAAGHGGKGCVAFHREAFRPKGGPSGGNGGRGGSVILRADHDLNNLIAQFYQPRLIAANGKPGMGKGMDGPAGKDLVVRVPRGTLVWRLTSSHPDQNPVPVPVPESDSDPRSSTDSDAPPASDPGVHEDGDPDLSLSKAAIVQKRGARALELDLEADADTDPGPASGDDEPGPGSMSEPETPQLVADLTEDGQEFVLCRGGRGGLGNRNFATASRQTPRFAQPGEPGEAGEFKLELRLIAEVGLVGYPNAGKSTLLTAISRARPKIAAYPFTTLHPNIGIVEFADHKRLTVCDVPGIIEGAHQNVGLGHAFLRHIQRCRVLLLLIDMAGVDGRRPEDDFRQLRRELELYDPDLAAKPYLVAANKMDEPMAPGNLKVFREALPDLEPFPISAGLDEGIDALTQAMRSATENAPEPGAPPVGEDPKR